MKNIIIGTAGHVDHGKSTLIRALTGIETDRLIEEKKRGITIELGFAHMQLPDGSVAGIVDVPGHEKFIKNMLAGAGGMDLVLLVIAADEGCMPQTREHLDILSLLDAKNGVVVLTKCDMVDEEWLEVVTEEVRAELVGSFLEAAPILPVSATTGQGLDALRQVIYETAKAAHGKNTALPARLHVDRVFTMEGFGTVVTGTLLEGAISEGDELMLYPAQMPVRVRGVEVFGEQCPTAYAGQRTAINLAGVRRGELVKGDTLATPGSMQPVEFIDVKLSALADSGRILQHGARFHFYHGTRDLLCRLALLDADALAAGEEGYAQLRFEEPVAVKKGDRFVLRFYSPLETVGGGIVLDPAPQRHRRHDAAVLAALAVREGGSGQELFAQALLDANRAGRSEAELGRQLALSDGQFAEAAEALVAQGGAAVLAGKLLHTQFLDDVWQRLQKALLAYQSANALLTGMPRDEARRALGQGIWPDPALCDAVLAYFEGRSLTRQSGGRVCTAGYAPQLTAQQRELMESVERAYRDGGFSPPEADEVQKLFGRDKNLLRQVLEALTAQDVIIPVAPGISYHRDCFERALREFARLAAGGEVLLAQYRDALGTSRKYALALLEHFDRRGFTQKRGEGRSMHKNFPQLDR